jgi:hypothetical protein
MPDPYERHSRNSWEWGPVPARGQSRAAAADQDLGSVKRLPAKKDPSRCKAAHWKGPHQRELRVKEYGGWQRKGRCAWVISWTDPDKLTWNCLHEAFCPGCGKVLATVIGFSDCPDAHPVTGDDRAWFEKEHARRDALTARRKLRGRPVISGPQGYRKRKKEST